ncbi:hypothetical protein F5888DRAFT_1891405 [Russula emetica]|nr:hypothetical protein F5888DRAFT_1891405 [Russula emetica]
MACQLMRTIMAPQEQEQEQDVEDLEIEGCLCGVHPQDIQLVVNEARADGKYRDLPEVDKSKRVQPPGPVQYHSRAQLGVHFSGIASRFISPNFSLPLSLASIGPIAPKRTDRQSSSDDSFVSDVIFWLWGIPRNVTQPVFLDTHDTPPGVSEPEDLSTNDVRQTSDVYQIRELPNGGWTEQEWDYPILALGVHAPPVISIEGLQPE